jgi:hypothetical protein
LRENELLYSSHLPLGVPNGLVIHHALKNYSLLIIGDSKVDGVGGEVDGDGRDGDGDRWR